VIELCDPRRSAAAPMAPWTAPPMRGSANEPQALPPTAGVCRRSARRGRDDDDGAPRARTQLKGKLRVASSLRPVLHVSVAFGVMSRGHACSAVIPPPARLCFIVVIGFRTVVRPFPSRM
jgi:hypothetical protein